MRAEAPAVISGGMENIFFDPLDNPEIFTHTRCMTAAYLYRTLQGIGSTACGMWWRAAMLHRSGRKDRMRINR